MNPRRRGGLATAAMALAILIAAGLLCYTAVQIHDYRLAREDAEELAGMDSARLRPNLDTVSRMTVDGVDYVRRRGVETYLIIGVDRTAEQLEKGTPGQSDVILLLVMDPRESEFHILQIDRDAMVMVPIVSKKGTVVDEFYGQICLSYAFGRGTSFGCENVKRAVGYLFPNVEIDGYLCLDLDAISLINSSVGGVTVTIDEDLTAADPAFVQGSTVHLDDQQAERYVRARMNVDETTNENRLRRQDQYLQAWMVRMRERAGADPTFVVEFLRSLKAFSQTDMTEKKLTSIADSAYQYRNGGMLRLEGIYELDGYNEFYPDSSSVIETLLALYYQTEQ